MRIIEELMEIWPNEVCDKIDTYEEVTIKTLLDSSITGIFIDKKW